MKALKPFYINHRFFYILAGIGALFLVSFFVAFLYVAAQIALAVLLLLTVIDMLALFVKADAVEGERFLPDRLSNGDENRIRVRLKNNYSFGIGVDVIDETPFQFQQRDFLHHLELGSGQSRAFEYTLRPTARGEYTFGQINVFAKTPLRLTARRFRFGGNMTVASYPSFIQLRKYDLMAFSNHFTENGIKHIRRVGHFMEFEQIREYVKGDDIRTINWKATSKQGALMVNQYQDEKSQPVYQVIDTGRSMQMPFLGMSLLDYAINAALALSNIVIKKQDKVGMFTFSKKTGNYVVADRRAAQMQRMMETLYKIDTDFVESDFSRLFVDIKKTVAQRSLILLYTNFETMDALSRQLFYLKEIARYHLLIVIFFNNTELNKLTDHKATNRQQVYDKVIAERFAFEKRLIVSELKKHGIQAILTQPENLTVDTINKYIELKARGMI